MAMPKKFSVLGLPRARSDGFLEIPCQCHAESRALQPVKR
jgi:hypothetical protein